MGAVSEAAFMTGMERNGGIVSLGAYVSEGWVCLCAHVCVGGGWGALPLSLPLPQQQKGVAH